MELSDDNNENRQISAESRQHLKTVNYCIPGLLSKCSAGISWTEHRVCKFAVKSDYANKCMFFIERSRLCLAARSTGGDPQRCRYSRRDVIRTLNHRDCLGLPVCKNRFSAVTTTSYYNRILESKPISSTAVQLVRLRTPGE